jgi:hypothetical protein
MQPEIKEKLNHIEEEISKGNYNIGEMNFWKIVAQVKRDPKLIEEFADQIGRIDAKVFKKWARIVVPLPVGHAIELLATLISLGVVLYGVKASGNTQGIAMVAGAFALMSTLHPFAHYMVGRLVGIKFLFYFPNGPALIEPTLKTDYASYLRTPPLQRAAMHAAGAIMSILVFVFLLILAYSLEAPRWSLLILGGFLVINIPFELMPLVWVRLGVKIFSKSDTYRTFREWKIHKALKG